MDALLQQLQTWVGPDIDIRNLLLVAFLFTAGSLVFGFIGRFVFGKKSLLNQSVSSAIGILFIYAVTVVIHSFGLNLQILVSPLPFVALNGDTLLLFKILSADYVAICGEVLNMVILAFLVNLVNRWLPTGKKLFSWLFFRVLSVAIGMVLFAVANSLLTAFLPEGLLTWAPVILLALLIVMLLVGALKYLVGALLTTTSPLIGFLYTFFFASVVGKMLSRAVFTTAILTALVYGLNLLGITAVAIGTAVLPYYIPLLVLLLVLWFVVGKLL